LALAKRRKCRSNQRKRERLYNKRSASARTTDRGDVRVCVCTPKKLRIAGLAGRKRPPQGKNTGWALELVAFARLASGLAPGCSAFHHRGTGPWCS